MVTNAYVVVENGLIVRHFDNEAAAKTYKEQTGSDYVVVDMNKNIDEQVKTVLANKSNTDPVSPPRNSEKLKSGTTEHPQPARGKGKKSSRKR